MKRFTLTVTTYNEADDDEAETRLRELATTMSPNTRIRLTESGEGVLVWTEQTMMGERKLREV